MSIAGKKRPFRLVKFFATASFAVLLVLSFPFSVVISRQAKDILMRSYEKYALLLGGNLSHQVFQNFVIPVTTLYGKIQLREKQQYEWMDQIVRSTVHGLNIDLVNIYDIGKGIIAYSTEPGLLGQPAQRTEGYLRALKGENFSGLLSGDPSLDSLALERIGKEKKLRTYLPFRGIGMYTGESYVLGVFEIIQDLTPEYETIVRLQYLIFGLSSLVMGLIFVALLLIVHKAEGIIRERAQKQRELQAQLDQNERMAALGRMIAGVSHEIRNPLGIIRSTAELMGSLAGPGEAQRRLSDVIVEESSRLNNIVTEFLDFARPQQPNLEECDLAGILQRNLQFLEPELQRCGIVLGHGLTGQVLPLRADPHLLYRAFLNIFINALQSMEGGGRLDLTVTDQGDAWGVAVADTGCGVRPEMLDKIFDPFFSTKDKGSGLGLSIVRNIIEQHRGTIRIASAEGHGTTVTVVLPKSGPGCEEG